MYHTKCSCMVNGRSTLQFINTDVVKIFDLIQMRLSDNRCTLDQFNANVRNMILEYSRQIDNGKNAATVNLALEGDSVGHDLESTYTDSSPSDSQTILKTIYIYTK